MGIVDITRGTHCRSSTTQRCAGHRTTEIEVPQIGRVVPEPPGEEAEPSALRDGVRAPAARSRGSGGGEKPARLVWRNQHQDALSVGANLGHARRRSEKLVGSIGPNKSGRHTLATVVCERDLAEVDSG